MDCCKRRPAGAIKKNEKITVDIRYANEFLKDEIEQFKTLLDATGQVEIKFFDSLIRKNPRLLFAYDDEKLVGIGAIKIPDSGHKHMVFERAESSEKRKQYDYELGWIVSKIENKGIGTQIMKSLMEECKSNIYATVSSTNLSMISLLKKSGFERAGKENSKKRTCLPFIRK